MNNWVVGSRMAEPTVAEEVCSMCDHVPLRPQSVSVSAPRERYLSRARAGTDENSARDKTNRSKRHSVPSSVRNRRSVASSAMEKTTRELAKL